MHTIPDLPGSITHEIYADLCAGLPHPAPDTAEVRARRNDIAMAAVAALCPTNVIEAKHAVAIVIAQAYAEDCFRLANEYRNDIAASLRCLAQANATLRTMRSLLADYYRQQAVRDRQMLQMHPGAMQRAGYWFKEASVPGLSPDPDPLPAPEPAFEALPEAEQYALLYPDRAQAIRAAGGLPHPLTFGPPAPAVVTALLESHEANPSLVT
jgi:hypothetical protein